MDDFRICSDLCEENGFGKQAQLMRAIAKGGCKAYAVVERGFEYNDEIFVVEEGGAPRAVYLDKKQAVQAASQRNAEMFRKSNPMAFCYDLDQITDLTPEELSARISKILGTDFEWPDAGFDIEERIFPESATDEQMLAITKLFTLNFYYVVETKFAG
jgi:hypothetical protein